MSCCNTNYLGVFCTDQNTSVFGFSVMKDGVMTTKYYNTSDNSLFTGFVLPTCSVGGGSGGDDVWATN